MKPGNVGNTAATAAILLFSGCAADDYAVTDTYRATYADVNGAAPAFVARRTVYIDNANRVVPVYRTGDEMFYTYAGRRYPYTDTTVIAPATSTVVRRTAYSSGRYRVPDRVAIMDDPDDVVIAPSASPQVVTQETEVIGERVVTEDKEVIGVRTY